MKAQGPILVPLDGSELAESALRMAVEMAHAERTHVVLMSVWQEPGSGTPAAISMELRELARDHFKTYLAGVRDRLGQPEIRIIVRDGDPADTILEVAREVSARMIVLASHGRSGIGRWIYGSTAARLLQESRVPLLVTGPNAIVATSTTARHVLVPLDGGPLSEVAVEAGVRVAMAVGAKLSLVRCVPWAYETYPYAGVATYLPALDDELEAGAREYIKRMESSVNGKVEVQGFVIRGMAAAALLEFERSHHVDLVVMSTHARTGLTRAVLGSTAGRLLQGTAPVLLIRPNGASVNESQRDEATQRVAAGRR